MRMTRIMFRAIASYVVLVGISQAQTGDIATRVTDQNRTGDLPFSTSIGSSVEHVDLGTGALNIKIPLIDVPGRGLDSQLYLRWSSNFWVARAFTNTMGNPYFQWTPDFLGLWLSNRTGHASSGFRIQCQGSGTYFGYSNNVYIDPAGVKRAVAAESMGGIGLCVPTITSSPGPDFTAEGMWATMATENSVSVLLADGSTEDVEDANGNEEDNIGYLGHIADTLGRAFYTTSTTTDGHGNALQTTYTHVDTNGATQTYTVNWELTPINTSFGASAGPYGVMDELTGSSLNVINNIVLPNGQQYGFKYDGAYGEITEIDFPAGGVIKYTWGTLEDHLKTRRYVASRTEVTNGVSSTWNLNLSVSGSSLFTANTTYSNTVTYPSAGSPPQQNQSVFVSTGGGVSDVQIFSGQAVGTPMREYKIVYTWDHDPTVDDACYNSGGNIVPPLIAQQVGLRPTSVTTILEDGQTQSQTQYDYETISYVYYPNHCADLTENSAHYNYTTSRGNVTEIRQYGWGSGSPGALIRRIDKTYLHNSNSNYLTYNIVNKVLQDTTYDSTANTCNGLSQPCAQTQYEYDNYVQNVNALISTSSTPAPQHDYTHYPSTFIYRGNVTRVMRWPNTAAGNNPLTTVYTYDDLGNIRAVQDLAGNTTSYSYADNWSGTSCPVVPSGDNGQAYVTQITDALGHQVKRTMYQCSGLLEARHDQNDLNAGRTGALYSYDWSGRLTQKQDTHLTTDSSWGSTSNTYNDVPPVTIATSTAITSTLNKTSVATMDGLGRAIETQLTSDPDGTTEVDTTYDALGRKSTVSNPYRAGTPLPTDGITTTNYDPLSRVTSVSEPDGSSSSTSYSLNCITASDEAGTARQSCSDPLGRMTSVFEDPGAFHLNYETDYTYDTLGNLLTVTQNGSDTTKARKRTFAYDAMSRLMSATNPESGTTFYAYATVGGGLCAGDPGVVCTKKAPL